MRAGTRAAPEPAVTLAPLADGDREALLRMASDPRIGATYMLPDLGSPERAEAFFRRMQALSLSETRYLRGIRLEGALIGMIHERGTGAPAVELGYFIDPAHWGQGCATAALRIAIREMFRRGFDEVRAGFFEDNPASRRVMEKCGMRLLPGEEFIPDRGRLRRCLTCAIRREDAPGPA